MSIIYDALKKTQAHRAALEYEKLQSPPVAETLVSPTLAPSATPVAASEAQRCDMPVTAAINDEKRYTQPSRRTVLLILVGVMLSVALIHALMTHNPFQRHVAPKPLPTHLHQLKMQLDGIFLGGKDKLAMINHSLISLGDQLDGLRVVAIEEESVKLQDDQHTLVLHMR